jgi:hypothetical protein
MSHDRFDMYDFESLFEAIQAEYAHLQVNIGRAQAEHMKFTDEMFRPENSYDYLRVVSLLNDLNDFLQKTEGVAEVNELQKQAMAMRQSLLPEHRFARQNFDVYMKELTAEMMLNKLTETLDLLAENASQYIHDVSTNPNRLSEARDLLKSTVEQYEKVHASLKAFVTAEKHVLPGNVADRIHAFDEKLRHMHRVHAQNESIYQASRGYIQDLNDLQERLSHVQESRRSPSLMFQEEDKAEEDELRELCQVLKDKLSVTEVQAETVVQQQAMTSFQHKLEEIVQQLDKKQAPVERHSPVNLAPKNNRHVASAQLQAESLAVKNLAERVRKQVSWPDEVRTELQKHLAQGRLMMCIYALRAQERAALARPELLKAHHDALRRLNDFLPNVTQNVGGKLKKKIEKFSKAQQTLEQEALTLQTQEETAAHMQRLLSAVHAFFAEPLGDMIDWEAGYQAALTVLQSSEKLLKASLAPPAVEDAKRASEVDNALETCVKAHETMQQASKAYQAALGGNPARKEYEKACKELGYAIRSIDRERDKKTVILTGVQAQALQVLKEDLLREVNQANPMLTEIEQEKCKRACEKLDVIAEMLDLTLSDAHSAFEEAKNQSQASQQEKLVKLRGLIKQRAQGPGVGGFDLWRADERRFFANARPMLHNILDLEAQAQAVTTQYEKALVTLQAEAERVGEEASEALGLPQQIKAYETRLKELKAWSADSALGVYASALVDDALTSDIDNAIATFFKSTQKMEMLASKQAFKQDLARLKQVMKAVHADPDVVVDVEDRQRFEMMTRETFHGIEDTKQAMEVFLAEDDLTPFQRTAVQALHDEVCAMEAELGIPSQAALQAFDKHLNTAHTPQAALKDAIEHGIDGLKNARQKLKTAQDKNRNLLVKNAARAKTKLSDTLFREVRSAEDDVLLAVSPIVQEVATREQELQTLIGQYARELHRLEGEPDASIKEIKQVKKNLKGFEPWKASSDFEQYRALLNEDKTSIDEADDAVNAFVALLKEKQEEFREPQFKSDLVLLKQCMEKMAKNKDAVLGEQEEKIYENFVNAMEPLYGMKQELDALLAPDQDAPALTVAQQAALEGLRDDISVMEAELSLPSKRDLIALEAHRGGAAINTVSQIYEGLDELEKTLNAFEQGARLSIQHAAENRGPYVPRDQIETSRSDVKAHVKVYKIYLDKFKNALEKSRYQALRHEDRALSARLSRFETVLLELESNVDEPWDLQWARRQTHLFLDGVRDFGHGGWQGCKDLLEHACAGFGYLRDVVMAFGGPSANAAVVQEKKTDYQRREVPYVLNDILTGGWNGQSYHDCAIALRDAKQVLLEMIPASSMLPGVNLFGRKPQVVVTSKTLKAFEAQKAKVSELRLQLQTVCIEALRQVETALNNPNEGERLSPTQTVRFEELEVEIKAKQEAGNFEPAEKAKIMKYLNKLGGTPDGADEEVKNRHDL